MLDLILNQLYYIPDYLTHLVFMLKNYAAMMQFLIFFLGVYFLAS